MPISPYAREALPELADWADQQSPAVLNAAEQFLLCLRMVKHNPPNDSNVRELARYGRLLEEAIEAEKPDGH